MAFYPNECAEFRDCLGYNELKDIPFKGFFSLGIINKVGRDRFFCKLDRMLGNGHWLLDFPNAMVTYLLERDFDHTPCIFAFDLQA